MLVKLQIKKDRTENGALYVSDEYSGSVDELSSALRIPDVQETVTLKGGLITERKIYTFGENSTICFDENMYLGVTILEKN